MIHLQAEGVQSVSDIANANVLWVVATAVLAVVALQSVIYLRAVRRNCAEADMTKSEVNAAFRAGAISSIGPSLAVVLVAVSLLPLFGTPSVLVRIGLIGSAGTELGSASAAAKTMGAELGGAGWDADVFTVALFAMSLSGAGWMICALLLTPILAKGDSKIRQVNPALMAVVPTAALLGAFSALVIQEIPKSDIHFSALVVSAAIMTVCLLVAKKKDWGWLREWALGFSTVGALVVAGIMMG